jgi:hypothetical protein
MTDILGQALQKITLPEISIMAEEAQAEVPDASSGMPVSSGIPVSSGVPMSSGVPVSEPVIIQESCETAPRTSAEHSPVAASAATRPNALQYLLSHRRQAAAIVVAVCIAVFWFDGGSSSVDENSADTDSAQADVAEAELMLDEFDAIEVSPLREPAEPSDVAAADPFPLTIPQAESDAAQVQVSSRGSDHPLLNERIGDVRNESAVQAESNGSLEFPAQPSSDSSPPAIPRSVRFTGRIQPLN